MTFFFMWYLDLLRLLYLVKRIFARHVMDIQVLFQLPKGPHTRPAVLLTNRHQQRSDRIIELRDSHRIPGSKKDNVCNKSESHSKNVRGLQSVAHIY